MSKDLGGIFRELVCFNPWVLNPGILGSVSTGSTCYMECPLARYSHTSTNEIQKPYEVVRSNVILGKILLKT